MSQTRSIAGLFEGDAKLETLNTGNKGQRWAAMPNVTTAASMFKGCAMLGAVTGMEYWDMAQVLNFSSMFQGCTVLPNRMIEQAGKWQLNTDTATTVSMANMFQGCATITTLDGLLDWNTSRVNTFAYMFENCASLLYANGVRNWTTDICMDYTAMFQGDRALKEFNAKNWVVDRGCAYENTFYLCMDLNRCVLGEGWSTIKEPTRVDPFQNIVNVTLDPGQSYSWKFTAPQWGRRLLRRDLQLHLRQPLSELPGYSRLHLRCRERGHAPDDVLDRLQAWFHERSYRWPLLPDRYRRARWLRC